MAKSILDKILHDDEEVDSVNVISEKEREDSILYKGVEKYLPVIIFFAAFAVRVIVLILTDPNSPGWYDDTFHHWQIGYLTKEIGLHQGFLRLWDLKGMEYFWGLLHPLVLVVLFAITGSVSIVIPRLLSAFCGSLVIALLFLLVRKYFNTKSAIMASVFAILMPVSIYSDIAGLQEPLALSLLLLAIYILHKKPFFSGVLLALSGMVRAEYWLFALALFMASLFSRLKNEKKAVFAVGYIIPVIFYMKYLASHAGNAIYPIYWNFLASVKGEWFADVTLSPFVQNVQLLSKLVFIAGVIICLIIFYKKPKYYLLFLLGFGNILFLAFMFGFGAYLKGYVPRFWVDRLFAWPYTFLGILLSVLPFYYLPKKINSKFISTFLGVLIIGLVLGLTQLVWPFMLELAAESKVRLAWEEKLGSKGGEHYQGGSVLIPEDRPQLTYFLAKENGVRGRNIVGQMFDPFYYIEGDAFLNWGENSKVVIDWIKTNDIRLLVVYPSRQRYTNLVEAEPQLFNLLETMEGVNIYEISSE